MVLSPLVPWGAIGAVLIGLFAGWSIRDWKADADTLAAYERADKLRDRMQAKIDTASQGYEDWRGDAEADRIETRNTIREIYRNVEVPTDCAVPAAATSLLQERITSINATTSGQSGISVPEVANRTNSADRP